MLALLGWNPGTEQEIFNLSQLISEFDLERVNKSGARFDPEKTKWFQHYYLQQKSDEELAELFQKYLEKQKTTEVLDYNKARLQKIIALLKERATFVNDFWEQGDFFFIAPSSYAAKAAKKAFKEDTPEILKHVVKLLTEVDDFSAGKISSKIKDWITSQEMGFGKVMMPLRLSLVGEMKGPDVFEIISVLGKEETIRRIDNAILFIRQK